MAVPPTGFGRFDLSPATWALTFAVFAVLAYGISSVFAWRRLRHFDGPFVGRFSYLWILRTSGGGAMAQRFDEAGARYGSTVRIGPNELLTSDLDLIRRTSSARSKYTRSSWYRLMSLDPYDEAMFNTLDTAAHDRIKAQTAPGYAGKDNPGLESEIDGMVTELVDKIMTKYAASGSGEPKPQLDLASMAQYFTLDSISKVAFGEAFGLMREERDIHGHMEMLHEVSPGLVVTGGVPYLRAIMESNLVLGLMGPKPGDKKGIGKMLPIGKRLVENRFGPDAKNHNDMLGSFIRHGLTQRQCETEALFQIIAGSDTTATTIRSGLLFLLATPRAYHALQAEIDAGVAAGRVSSPVITSAEAAELPYLQGVILEALRLHPPFTGLPFKVVPPGGDTLADGRYVPAGTLVSPNFWATGRHRETFGPDADVFRPERWLEGSKEERVEKRRVAELVFGYGRWGCAGKMIALMELNKVYVELLRRFDFQLVYPYRPWKSVNYNLFLQNDMWVAVTLREAHNQQ